MLNLCVSNKESACAKSPIDDSLEGMTKDASRLHLRSTKKKLVSPLKKYEVTKFARRRQIKRLSLLEEDTLRTVMEK
jgi:telomeric repeat-binding factor 2